jgi:hypothetical protein
MHVVIVNAYIPSRKAGRGGPYRDAGADDKIILKLILKGTEFENTEWIHLPEDRPQLWAAVVL